MNTRVVWWTFIIAAFFACGAPQDGFTAKPTAKALASHQVGKSHFGAYGYIEYIAGDGPLIIVAPHGGHLIPKDIPIRVPRPKGDANSQEYARGVAREFKDLTGKSAHVIINHIPKQYFGAVSGREDAGRDYPLLEDCWDKLHEFIEAAKTDVIEDWGAGHYLECHTRGGDKQIDVGLGWTRSVLNKSAEPGAKNPRRYLKTRKNTLQNLGKREGVDFLEAVRGKTSLGGLLEGHGYIAIPSPKHPSPGDRHYFLSGYNCWKHGRRESRNAIDATHLEVHYSYIRKSERKGFEEKLADSLVAFLDAHYKFNLRLKKKATAPE